MSPFYSFWLSVLLANLLVMLKFKGTSVAQSFIWREKRKVKMYILLSFSLNCLCFLCFLRWCDIIQVILAGCEKLFKMVSLAFMQEKPSEFQRSHDHCRIIWVWVLSSWCL